MASDIVITPNRGSTTVNAKIDFTGASTASSQIRLEVLPDNSLSFVGTTGSLFSIADSVTGSLMSVNDASGLPILEVFDTDKVVMGQYNQNTLVVNSTNVGIGAASPASKLEIRGGTTNQTNDATVYITADNDNDWALVVDKNRSAASEYGLRIITGSAASYALAVYGSGSLSTRIAGNGDIYAPRMYDSTATAYYVDPGSTSNLNGLTVAGAITGTLSGNATTATTATNWGTYGAVPAAGTSFATANTIGRSDGNGYTFFGYINSNVANNENGTVSQFIITNGSDNYFRKASLAHVKSQMSLSASDNVQFNSIGLAIAASGTAGSISLNQSGTRSWSITPTGGNLVFASGDSAGTISISTNLTVAGNLTVNGTTTTVNSTTVTIDDPIFTLGGDTAPASDDNKDRGIEFRWHNGAAAKVGFFGFDDSTGYFTFIPDATNSSEVFSGTQGDIQASNFRGALVGNATTATTWQTARTLTIGATGKSVNGSADVSWTVAEIQAAAGTPASQSLTFDAVKTPGLYQYDGTIGATKPPDNSLNYRTIEIGTSTRYSQIALPWDSENMYFRRQQDSTWTTWRTVLHSGNYNSYAPTLTGTGASGTWGISITGNAATATSADQIDGVAFRNTGSNAGTAADSLEQNGITYVNSNISLLGQTDGALFSQAYNSNWQHQIYGDYRTGQIVVRGKNNGTWQSWRTVLDSSNYTSYTSHIGNGTLTLNTSGNGISGSTSFTANQSGAGTFTVTSNATSANTASTLVFRDTNGDFQARNITTQDDYTNGWFRNNSNNTGLYNQSTYLHLSSTGANTSYLDISTVGSTNSGIRFYTGGHVNTLRGYIVANTSNELMLWNAGGSYSARFTSTQSEIYQDTYVPTLYGNIMYDRQSTSFYVDPGSTSVFNRLNVAGYSMRSSATLDLSNTGTYSTTNYYPITIPLATGMPTRMRIVNALNSNVPSWSTHASGFTCHVEWTSNGSGWGTIAVQRSIHRYTEGFTNSTICGGITQMTNGSIEVIWLRGGGRYYFEADADVTPTIQSTTYTNNGQSVTPGSAPQNDVISAATDTRPSFQRLNLTMSTGTAPMTVSSTTLVNNLNADLLDGYNSAETGSSIILRTQSNGYLNIDNWIQVGSAGLYSSVNSAHWTPNQTGAYSPWRIISARGSYGGIYDDYSGVNWMHDSAGNGGIYRQANSRWFLYHNVSENCLGIGGSSTLNGWRARVNGALYTDAGTYSSAFYASSNSTYYLDLAGAVSGRINGRIYIGTTTSYTAGGSPNLTIVKTSAGARADHLELRNESTNANTACSINFMMTGGDSSNPNARIVSTRSASFDGTLEFYVGGNLTTGIFINSSGNVGIGRTDPGYKLDVNGSTRIVTALGVGTAPSGTTGEIRATDNITAYYSDERLKTKLGAIENPIEKVKALSGFYFEANETAIALGYQKKREVGVSAQEVQAILPEIIAPAPIDDKYMTVRYEKLIPLLIEAIKEQQKQIEELKSLLSNNK